MTNTAQSHFSLSAAPAVDPAVPAERSSYPAEGTLPQCRSEMKTKKRTSPSDASDEVHPPFKHQRTAVGNTEDGEQRRSAQTLGGKRKRAPKKPVRPPKPAPTDPATWPESQLGDGDRVTATEAKQQYRVTTWDLKYLPCEIMGSGYMKYNPTQLYWERDIERVAWEKHGGPEGWKWYLDKLRASHQKRFPGREFICPFLLAESESDRATSDDTEHGTHSHSSCQAA